MPTGTKRTRKEATPAPGHVVTEVPTPTEATPQTPEEEPEHSPNDSDDTLLTDDDDSCSNTSSSDTPPRRKQRRSSTVGPASRRPDPQIQPHQDPAIAPLKTTQPPPPRALKLPTVSSSTLKRLANRQKVVSVDEVLAPKPFGDSANTPAQQTTSPSDYLRGVSIIAAYRMYFFPTLAVQWGMYQVWLQGRAAGLSAAALRHIDGQGRSILSQYPYTYHSPADLNEGVQDLPPSPYQRPATSSRPAPPPRQGPQTSEACIRWNNSTCYNGVYCRYQHACRVCGLGHKASAVHGPPRPGNAPRPLLTPHYPAGRY